MKDRKPQLVPLEVQFLAYTQMKGKLLVRVRELAGVLDISAKQERELLSGMARAGLIIRLTLGVYLVPPRVPPGGKYFRPRMEHQKMRPICFIDGSSLPYGEPGCPG